MVKLCEWVRSSQRLRLCAVPNGIRRTVTHIRSVKATKALRTLLFSLKCQKAEIRMIVRLRLVALSEWIRHGEFKFRQILIEMCCAMWTNKVNWCLRLQRLKANRLLNIHTKYDNPYVRQSHYPFHETLNICVARSGKYKFKCIYLLPQR